ncbi:MAG: DUF4132 domain-containing protein [Bacteroidota bacterium]
MTLFQYCAPIAVKRMTDDQIIPFLEFYEKSHFVKVNHRRFPAYERVDISKKLLELYRVFDLVTLYLKHHSLSERLRAKLTDLSKAPAFNDKAQLIRNINAVIQRKYSLVSLKEHRKNLYPLQASKIATKAEWKWLQAHDLPFIDSKTAFYKLIEQLSKIDYFNQHELSVHAELQESIRQIDPMKYEVFVLDLYQLVDQEGKKRSSWFLGEKARAFQIFVWILHYLEAPNQYAILSKLAEKCFTKIPKVGPISRKVGDTVLRVLDESETIEGLGVLLNLKARAKYAIFREVLTSSVRKAIHFTGLDPNEVEDFFINDYGLQGGKMERDFGNFQSMIEVVGEDKVQLLWLKPDGKSQKSIPAKVKSDYPEELKLWKVKQRDIKNELMGQKKRIEGFWHRKKTWSYANWEKYLLHHELLRFIVQKLIWRFDTGDHTILAIWENGKLVDAQSIIIGDVSTATVSLWHPCQSAVEVTEAWRNYMLEREIKQPFKQAFREVYLVTGAEITTATYSNRFLDHVIRHGKLVALAKQRAWTYSSIFSEEDPFIVYPECNVIAGVKLDNHIELAAMGKVYFRDLRTKEIMQIANVPAIIFSEAMRDVDLFVGLCSIGIEEGWSERQHRDYWRGFSVADLSESAKIRRSVLANMLPKLKINEQCELTKKYLRVKGKVRTYNIHLASGNILMEPNGEYLCIVPDRKKNKRVTPVFLPFDDDATFSIILSKAFLLAEDDKIEDRVILNQINRGRLLADRA